MNKPKRIQVLCAVSILFCFIAGLFISSTHKGLGADDDAGKAQAHFALEKAPLFSPPAQPKNLSGGTQLYPYPLKKSHQQILAGFKTHEMLLAGRGQKYVCSSASIALYLSVAVIIYPFHYFW